MLFYMKLIRQVNSSGEAIQNDIIITVFRFLKMFSHNIAAYSCLVLHGSVPYGPYFLLVLNPVLSKLNYIFLTIYREYHPCFKVFFSRMKVSSVHQELHLTLNIGKSGVWSRAFAVVDGKNKYSWRVIHSIYLRCVLGVR